MIIENPAVLDRELGAQPLSRTGLHDRDVHVWQADSSAISERAISVLADCLSPEELADAGEFRHALDRRRFIFRRGLLRHLLGSYTSIRPNDIAFLTLSSGKRVMVGPAVPSWSISHRDDITVVAIAKDCKLGIDVASIDQSFDCAQVVQEFFPKRLKDEFDSAPAESKGAVFALMWTQIEAAAKADGLGLADYLQACSSAEYSSRFDSELSVSGYHCFCPRRGYTAAVLANATDSQISHFIWNEEMLQV